MDAIVARRFKRCHEALVRWAGFDSSYDSWEPEDDIHPGLIKEYESARIIDAVDVSPVMEALQDSISSRLLETRQEQFGIIVPLPGAAFQAVARQVAELLRRPPSRKGKAPLQLKQVRSGQRLQREQVTLTKMADLEWLRVAGAAARKPPRQGLGSSPLFGGQVEQRGHQGPKWRVP